ncbi:uncharacterized protein LOC115743016 isoform X2 [Rhodamnia argentea]|uniref:Uncharacterized protein LOC115743016 isoform X2 n=1 Tax=Rhodamnia argentea TaxID=178133 RepID=A0ABM3H5U4_9MYRT|nr:uncharacterized protein LOC115743016 isoform X2 [Rhodamnia argentea]
MSDSDRSRMIPDGWIFRRKIWRGSDASHYFCPATGQRFSTYKALMHYVEYAKKAKVSIYAPDFGAGKSSGKRKGRSRAKTKVCKPATRGKVPRKGEMAASAALEELPSDVGQITVPKSGISGKFPPKNWEEACLPDSKEVSPAVGQTKVSHQRTEAGSAALKQLPSDVGQNKVLKFGIGGEFPPKGWKEACLADPEKIFPAVDQTKVPRKRTEAGSAALKQLPSAVGQNKVPKFGISENIPCKRRKAACLLDAKELSPGDNYSKDLKSALGVEYPPKRLREGYLQLSPAVDPTSIWSPPIRAKIPPRRKNYFGQSSNLGVINESEVNIGSMDMSTMGDFGGFQPYAPLEGGSSETNYDWAFEENIFPFRAEFEAGEEPTISALDNGVQIYMEPSRPCIEHQYRRRNERNKSTRPTVGQLRKKET